MKVSTGAATALSSNAGSKVTAHVLVRDEEMYVSYSLLSVAPYIARTIVFLDSRSVDGTLSLIERAQARYPTIELHIVDIDDARFGDWRNRQIEMTDTPFFLILDGDEVYPRASIHRLLSWIDKLPEDKNSVWICFYWFINDHFHVCDPFPGRTIRLCRTAFQGRRCACSGPHPGEMHHYRGETPQQLAADAVTDESVIMYHYSWIQKPVPQGSKISRIKNMGRIKSFDGPQPEVFNELW